MIEYLRRVAGFCEIDELKAAANTAIEKANAASCKVVEAAAENFATMQQAEMTMRSKPLFIARRA